MKAFSAKMCNFIVLFCFLSCIIASERSVAIAAKYIPVERGNPNSANYRIFYTNEDGNAISPMHDIPLHHAQNVYNMVVEVPRWTTQKMEISRDQPLNPIHQDVKNGQLRYVANTFPYHGYIWNYGAFPQTWEYPGHLDKSTGAKGDNDPIDVIEIGSRVAKRGEVLQVKILGIVGLVDEGETDWKVIVIDVKDAKADQVWDIDDVEKAFPGLLKETFNWFRIYKIPDGKPANNFAFNGEAKNATFATSTVNETNRFWRSLLQKEITSDEISCATTSVTDSSFWISQNKANEILAAAPALGEAQPVHETVDTWHYVEL